MAAAAMRLCGAMALPRAAPRPCAPSIVATSTSMASAVATCRSLKSAFEAVAEPVTKVPSAPTAGASSGQVPPSASAAAAAMASTMPAWTMIRARLSMAMSATATGTSVRPASISDPLS